MLEAPFINTIAKSRRSLSREDPLTITLHHRSNPVPRNGGYAAPESARPISCCRDNKPTRPGEFCQFIRVNFVHSYWGFVFLEVLANCGFQFKPIAVEISNLILAMPNGADKVRAPQRTILKTDTVWSVVNFMPIQFLRWAGV